MSKISRIHPVITVAYFILLCFICLGVGETWANFLKNIADGKTPSDWTYIGGSLLIVIIINSFIFKKTSYSFMAFGGIIIAYIGSAFMFIFDKSEVTSMKYIAIAIFLSGLLLIIYSLYRNHVFLYKQRKL